MTAPTATLNNAGDHHDGMEWFGLSANGSRDDNATERGLLCDEPQKPPRTKSSPQLLPCTPTAAHPLAPPAAEVDKNRHPRRCRDRSCQTAGKWSYLPGSAKNFRLTALTPSTSRAPRGSSQLVTKFSPTGTKTRGTLNNCGTGKTVGHLPDGRKNWFGYFTRGAADDAARGNDKRDVFEALRPQGAASRHGWETGGTDDKYQRWNNSKLGTSVDGSDDYRNKMNGMGYIVEINPYNKAAAAEAHRHWAASRTKAPPSARSWWASRCRCTWATTPVANTSTSLSPPPCGTPPTPTPPTPMAVGDKYLDSGKLYVAKSSMPTAPAWSSCL